MASVRKLRGKIFCGQRESIRNPSKSEAADVFLDGETRVEKMRMKSKGKQRFAQLEVKVFQIWNARAFKSSPAKSRRTEW